MVSARAVGLAQHGRIRQTGRLRACRFLSLRRLEACRADIPLLAHRTVEDAPFDLVRAQRALRDASGVGYAGPHERMTVLGAQVGDGTGAGAALRCSGGWFPLPASSCRCRWFGCGWFTRRRWLRCRRDRCEDGRCWNSLRRRRRHRHVALLVHADLARRAAEVHSRALLSARDAGELPRRKGCSGDPAHLMLLVRSTRVRVAEDGSDRDALRWSEQASLHGDSQSS
jgi:hypothetical protein